MKFKFTEPPNADPGANTANRPRVSTSPFPCPQCGVLNPPESERCDCGYLTPNFEAANRAHFEAQAQLRARPEAEATRVARAEAEAARARAETEAMRRACVEAEVARARAEVDAAWARVEAQAARKACAEAEAAQARAEAQAGQYSGGQSRVKEWETIQQIFRQLSLKFHPDRTHDNGDSMRILNDWMDSKRKEYADVWRT